jgi:hypothetical protein
LPEFIHARFWQNDYIGDFAALEALDCVPGRGIGNCKLVSGFVFEGAGEFIECRFHGDGTEHLYFGGNRCTSGTPECSTRQNRSRRNYGFPRHLQLLMASTSQILVRSVLQNVFP